MTRINVNGYDVDLVRCRNPWGKQYLKATSWLVAFYNPNELKAMRLNGMAYGVTTVQNGTPCQMIRNTNWDLNVAETENFGTT